jgi:acyl-CoA carboxylase subunit beta
MAVTDDRPATAAADWVRCERCSGLVYGKRFRRNLNVCPECGWHAHLTAQERLDQLLDRGCIRPEGLGRVPRRG